MTWYAAVAVAVLVVGSAATVASIGKPRKPMDSSTAVIALIVNGLMIWAIVALAEQCS